MTLRKKSTLRDSPSGLQGWLWSSPRRPHEVPRWSEAETPGQRREERSKGSEERAHWGDWHRKPGDWSKAFSNYCWLAPMGQALWYFLGTLWQVRHGLLLQASIIWDYEVRRPIFKNKVTQNRSFQMGVALVRSPVGRLCTSHWCVGDSGQAGLGVSLVLITNFKFKPVWLWRNVLTFLGPKCLICKTPVIISALVGCCAMQVKVRPHQPSAPSVSAVQTLSKSWLLFFSYDSAYYSVNSLL